ncbi:hypothetical protein ACLMJK_008297 [Lecanora helva]
MAFHTPQDKALQIALAPNHILINVVQALNGNVNHFTRDVDVHATTNKAIDHVQNLLEHHDRPLILAPVRTRREKEKFERAGLKDPLVIEWMAQDCLMVYGSEDETDEPTDLDYQE